MPKESFYFKHDYHARSDEKIARLIRKHGWAAYGLYWALVEMLYENDGKIGNDYEALAYDLRADRGLLKSLAEESELFYRVGSTSFGSKSVDRRLRERRDRSRKAAEAGRLGGEANAKRMLGECLATVKPGEERRVPTESGLKTETEQQKATALIASVAEAKSV
jgi:hypothetical protein